MWRAVVISNGSSLFGSLYGFGGFGGGVGFGGGGEQLPRADNDFSQNNPAIHYVDPPYTVGADLSCTPPIDRPST